MKLSQLIIPVLILLLVHPVFSLDRPEVTFKIFQFPANQIPRIDGDPGDWSVVPEDYVVGTDQLWEDSGKQAAVNPDNLAVRVRVGWVKGLNRLYFLYEAHDNYWDFALPGLHNDTFEVVVDGDASGGPLIDKEHQKIWSAEEVGSAAARPDDRITPVEANWAIHGVHAQNYHIFTPAKDKDWALAWGVQSWIKELPYANAAYAYHFQPGESGDLVLEFWITLFDYAGTEGAQRAVESVLTENKIIGPSWAIIDYDDVNQNANNGFWNLSRYHLMYGNASYLCAFQLMPLEARFRQPIEAQWSFKIIDPERRRVAFKDESFGTIQSWNWDFGDGTASTEQHPIHQYQRGGDFVVVLEVSGPEGKSRRAKVWDVEVR